jgi:hypothetical protein
MEHSTNKSTQVALQHVYPWLNIASDSRMSSNMAIIKLGKHDELIMKRIHLQSHSELLGLHQQQFPASKMAFLILFNL